MDKYIELIAVYWIDWQYTAIANTRYSVVLFALAFIMGALIITLLRRGKTAQLKKQVSQKESLIKQSHTENEAISNQQLNTTKQITELQQQLEQSHSSLEQEKQQYQSSLSNKDELLAKSIHEKNQEIETLKSTLLQKSQLTKQLQTTLDRETQGSEAEEKLIKLQKQLLHTISELKSTQQQLTSALEKRNNQAEPFDNKAVLSNAQPHRVPEVDLQLPIEKKVSTEAPARVQEQATIEHTVETIKDPVKEAFKQDQAPVTVQINKQADRLSQSSVTPLPSENNKITNKSLKFQTDSKKEPLIIPSSNPPNPVTTPSTPKIRSTARSRPEPIIEPTQELGTSFSEKLANFADKMDDAQGKWGAFFGKKS